MALSKRKQTSQFVQIGIFAVGTAALVFATFYLLRNFGSGQREYRIGVHFVRASGVAQGAQVFFSGVVVGSVDEIRLLPDNSVDLILAIASGTNIPKTSKFAVRPSLTGSPTVVITPPISQTTVSTVPKPVPSELILEKRILPISEQPVGTSPIALEDMLAQSQHVMQRSSRILALMRASKAGVFGHLQGARVNGAATSLELRAIPAQEQASLHATLTRMQKNIADAKAQLRRGNGQKVAVLATSLKAGASALNSSLHDLRRTAMSGQAKANLQASAGNMNAAMSNVSALEKQFSAVSKDRQTRSQLADAAAQMKAALEKLRSLLTAH